MSFLVGILSVLLVVISLFMILLVLIQRGRGGGLAGAFGSGGGQSAFGTRAGDTFTQVTIVVAVVWVLIAACLGMSMRSVAAAKDSGADSRFTSGAAPEDGETPVQPADDSPETPAAETPAAETPAAETPAAETPAAETPEKSDSPSSDEPAQADPKSEDAAPATESDTGAEPGEKQE
ncbi:MAG: preprotein translocase subunit SecG [Planctomycetaceae bacterium]|nr:preprotein translocase subunit SecG [Planctomycetaceae bacterium]